MNSTKIRIERCEGMRLTFALPVFLLWSCCLHAQDIPLIKPDQLEYWKTADNDTVYVLNFWATWCAPCVKELPAFERLQADYADQRVRVVLISNDFKRDLDTKVKDFVRKKGLKSQVVFMDEPNGNKYINRIDPDWSGAIPATLVISRKKDAFYFHEGELEYTELETLLKKAL